jgi:hypothetical protein
LILDVVGMSALGAIKPVSFFVGARGRCVCSGVLDCRGFAIFAYVYGVPGVEKEGRCCGEKDVAARDVSKASEGAPSMREVQ